MVAVLAMKLSMISPGIFEESNSTCEVLEPLNMSMVIGFQDTAFWMSGRVR